MSIARLVVWTWIGCLCAAVAGCPGNEDDDDATSLPDDDATADDDDSGVADDDTTGDDDAFVPDLVEGEVLVELNEFNNGGGGTVSNGRLYAAFYDVITPASGGPVYVFPEGTDECAVTRYTQEDINDIDPGETVYQSAGLLTLAGSGGTWEVDPIAAGTVVFYQTTLTPGTQLVYDSNYSIRTDGDDYPSFFQQDALYVPPELHLTLPTPSQNIVLSGDYLVQWTGGGTRPVWLIAAINSVQDFGMVHCKVANDGEFTIPGKYLLQLPEGGAGTLTLAQHDDTYVDVEGMWIKLSGGFSHDVLASTP